MSLFPNLSKIVEPTKGSPLTRIHSLEWARVRAAHSPLNARKDRKAQCPRSLKTKSQDWKSIDRVLVTARGGTETLHRKEVIQPQVPLRLPCYDFTPVTSHSLGACLLAVSPATSRATDFRDVTGGVYKARERIHPSVLIWDY